MIINLTSSLPTYKSMEFQQGLNIVLAEQHAQASKHDTRNGVGKTSLLEIIHFLLGSSVGANSLFRVAELADVTFTGTFILAGERWRVSRNTANPATVTLVQPHSKNAEEGQLFPDAGVVKELRVTDWTKLLTDTVFKIECGPKEKHCLTSRILYAYLIRRQADGAFREFSESMAKQPKLPQQAAMLYFLGLDWTIAKDWIKLNDKLKVVSNFENLAKNAEFKDVFPKEDELRSQLIIEQRRLTQMRASIDSFQILPEYKQIEAEADEVMLRLRAIADDNFQDSVRLNNLNQSLDVETITPQSDNLENFIAQVQILFKESVVDRLSKVREFHESVVRNRKDYLYQEINEINHRVESRNREQSQLLSRQRELLGILQASGGLDQYSKIQKELARLEGKVEFLQKQHDKAKEMSLIKIECDEMRTRLAHRLILNYAEQEDAIADAVTLYQEISNQLYQQSGILVVGHTEYGPDITINKAGQRSKGIKNMQIFTFDLMAAVLMTQRGQGPKCLIHDSHVFDGVDPRQVKSAIAVAAQLCEDYGFQYILCLNSDQLEDQENYKKYIVEPVLYDYLADGGLFGFRFN